MNLRTVVGLAALIWVGAAAALNAQYLGFNLRGDVGMKSGSQPGPGYYFVLPIYYRADYDSLRGASGNEIPGSFNTAINLLSPAVAVTTKFKMAGATYGFQAVPVILNQRLDLAGGAVQRSNSYGMGDWYFQPLILGWRKPRADFLAAYGFYAPTGSGSRSLGMWGHEVSGGTTVYLDEAKNWHASGTAFYEFHTTKNTGVTVGNILTVEGGVGRSFLKGAANAGMAYVMQWKVTDDSAPVVNPLVPQSKNKAYGIGPEISLPFFAKGATVGLLGFRYAFEMGNRSNFQGNNLFFSLTLARLNM